MRIILSSTSIFYIILQGTWALDGVFGLSSSSSSSSSSLPSSVPLLDATKLRQSIYSGRVYQHDNFLTEDEVQTVLLEINELEKIPGNFVTKGLSNTSKDTNLQKFSTKLDRSICPVSWFYDALHGTDVRDVPQKIRQLQISLGTILDSRPTIQDSSLNHECYYSKSEVGSRLPRHMDERHEELKGAKGWLLPSRRSLSWLIYLSDPANWDISINGGALRTYPQKQVQQQPQQQDGTNVEEEEDTTTHEGNLQIGWLVYDDGSKNSRPVYMDSWFTNLKGEGDEQEVQINSDGSRLVEPHCILYALSNDDGTGTGAVSKEEKKEKKKKKKEYLTKPWLTETLQGMSVWEFLIACAKHDTNPPISANEQPLLFLNRDIASQFAPFEDRELWDKGANGSNIPRGSEIVDIVPKCGTLVIFDSVLLPHQVELIHSGTRLALAGWFHEKTQEFPDMFY